MLSKFDIYLIFCNTNRARKRLPCSTDVLGLINCCDADDDARPKVERYVYNYNAGDFGGLRRALNAINLTSLVEHAIDINIAWQWKDVFLTAVSHYIPMKKSKDAIQLHESMVPFLTP